MSTYFKQHYLHDHKLAQRALLEFSRAMKSGRIIAFTGAMTTEAFGYGSWAKLQEQFAGDAIEIVDQLSLKDCLDYPQNEASVRARDAKDKIGEFKQQAEGHGSISANVGFSLIEEVLSQLRIKANAKELEAAITEILRQGTSLSDWPLDRKADIRSAYDLLRLKTAYNFRGPPASAVGRNCKNFSILDEDINTPMALYRAIGLTRFATLNYDFELEREAMGLELFKEGDEGQPVDKLEAPFAELMALWRLGERENFRWNLGTGNIRRVLLDGRTVESDIVNRERIDRMFEFAIGADDVDTHILHMHGRACMSSSMLVSYRDYDRLYRHNSLSRLPFEHAKKVLIGGNPILFVGLGMGEAEVNRELEEYISNNPYRRAAPTFLLWNAEGAGRSAEWRRAKRLDWLHRLGVLAIFDSDLAAFDKIFVEKGLGVTSSDRWSPKEKWEELPNWLNGLPAQPSFKEPVALNPNWGDWWDVNDKGQAQTFSLKNLANTVRLLPEAAMRMGEREEFIPKRSSAWRSMANRAKHNADSNGAVQFWQPVPTFPEEEGAFREHDHARYECKSLEVKDAFIVAGRKLATELAQKNLVCVIGGSGAGKGWLGRVLANDCGDVCDAQVHNRLLINGGFSFDTDSMLHGIACFLGANKRMGGYEPAATKISRGAYFRSTIGCTDPAKHPMVIIINGMDRFFGTEGQPLGGELDELLQLVAMAPPATRIKWVFMGSNRIRNYFEQDLGRVEGHLAKVHYLGVLDFGDLLPSEQCKEREGRVPALQMAVTQAGIEGAIGKTLSTVAPALWRKLEYEIDAYRALRPGSISGDQAGVRRAFYALVLDRAVLEIAIGKDKVDLANEVLRVLAFIGSPAEAEVIRHAPRIWSHGDKARLGELLAVLAKLGLILELTGFPDYGEAPPQIAPPRYALHRSLMTEIRFRFGIPLSEAKLSTAFNMSLYIAQPVDGYIPEAEVHDELGDLIDRLIGGYMDHGDACSTEGWASLTDTKLQAAVKAAFKKEDPLRADKDVKEVSDKRIACFYRMCMPGHIQCLRAALAVIRGFYSTTGILTLDEGDRLVRAERDGILHEHAERLDTMIDAFGKLMQARESIQDNLKDEKGNDLISADGKSLFGSHFGTAGPFYADELVWLHNERGVVRLAMGDLYEARRSFALAMKVNRAAVEFDDRAHNWRRIRLNQLTVDIESGELDLALRKMEEIQLQSKGISTNRKGKHRRKPLREDQLAVAITHGYEGFCLHLRGHRKGASDKYDTAISTLDKLEELRAQAYFARLRANLRMVGKDIRERLIELDQAHDLAISGRQLDIAYRIQIDKAAAILFTEGSTERQHKRANRMLEDAMSYALQTDTHRVRCEAAMTIARARLNTGDLEGALMHATDALTVAVRYGLELRKMTLRSLIGRILAERGHPVTAEQMAMSAIAIASRQKIQTAIDQAEACLQDITRISGLMTNTDLSGRRSF